MFWLEDSTMGWLVVFQNEDVLDNFYVEYTLFDDCEVFRRNNGSYEIHLEIQDEYALGAIRKLVDELKTTSGTIH